MIKDYNIKLISNNKLTPKYMDEMFTAAGILEASDSQIPKASISTMVSPWANAEFLDILEQRWQ